MVRIGLAALAHRIARSLAVPIVALACSLPANAAAPAPDHGAIASVTSGQLRAFWVDAFGDGGFNLVALQPADYIGPNQVAWFQFTIQAPAAPGTYRLYIRPLVEGAQWMEDYGVFWYVVVR